MLVKKPSLMDEFQNNFYDSVQFFFVHGLQCRSFVSLIPRLFLSLPLNFTHVNIVHEKLKQRESLVWNYAHSWPFPMNYYPTTAWKATANFNQVLADLGNHLLYCVCQQNTSVNSVNPNTENEDFSQIFTLCFNS